MPNCSVRACTAARLALTFTLIGTEAAAAPFTGPVSPYYLDDYFDFSIYVVQGGTVINHFPWVYSPASYSNYNEGILAVTNVVTTNGFGTETGLGKAGQYTLAGVPTGVGHNAQATPGFTNELQPDGTSDGKYNYTVQFHATDSSNHVVEAVVRTDLNWQNPTVLFSVEQGFAGIAYDPKNNSLWLSNYDQNFLSDWSLDGNLLSSFSTGDNALSALGFDPADSTLWGSVGTSNFLQQWTTTGVLLQTGVPTGLPEGPLMGGEFAEAGSPTGTQVTEPFSIALFGIGLAGLGYWRRRGA